MYFFLLPHPTSHNTQHPISNIPMVSLHVHSIWVDAYLCKQNNQEKNKGHNASKVKGRCRCRRHSSFPSIFLFSLDSSPPLNTSLPPALILTLTPSHLISLTHTHPHSPTLTNSSSHRIHTRRRTFRPPHHRSKASPCLLTTALGGTSFFLVSHKAQDTHSPLHITPPPFPLPSFFLSFLLSSFRFSIHPSLRPSSFSSSCSFIHSDPPTKGNRIYNSPSPHPSITLSPTQDMLQAHDNPVTQEHIPKAPQDDTLPTEATTSATTSATAEATTTTAVPSTAHPEPLPSPTLHHITITTAHHTQPEGLTISQDTESTSTTISTVATTSTTSSSPDTTTPPPEVLCAQCDRPMQGSFVRALGATYHLECFKCLVMWPMPE